MTTREVETRDMAGIAEAARAPWVVPSPRKLLHRFERAGLRGDYRLALVAHAGSTAALRERATALLGAGTDLRSLHPGVFASAALADVDRTVEAWAREPFNADLSEGAVRERRRRRKLPLWCLGRWNRVYVVLATPPLPVAEVGLRDLVARLPAHLGWEPRVERLEPGEGGVRLGEYVLERVRPRPEQTFLAYRLAAEVVENFLRDQREILRLAVGHDWARAVPPLQELRRRWLDLLADTFVAPAQLLGWERTFWRQMGELSIADGVRYQLARKVPSFARFLARRVERSKRLRKGVRRAG